MMARTIAETTFFWVEPTRALSMNWRRPSGAPEAGLECSAINNQYTKSIDHMTAQSLTSY